MIRRIFLGIGLIFIGLLSHAQESFTVKVSLDTMHLDQVLDIEFMLKNVEGDFQPPVFADFTIASGPMVSSHFSMINGEVSQRKSIKYLVIPKKSGTVTVEKASVKTNEQEISTSPITIYVIERNLQHTSKTIPKPISSTTTVKKRIMKRL